MDLVYWRSMRRTGVVFTGLVIALASLFQLSAITVLSHILLGIMCITFPLCLYYKLLELLHWSPGYNPFQWVQTGSAPLGEPLSVGLWWAVTPGGFQVFVTLFLRSYLDYDSSLTDQETVMLVEEVVLLVAFAVTEIKRLLFVESIIDSVKVIHDAFKPVWHHLLVGLDKGATTVNFRFLMWSFVNY